MKKSVETRSLQLWPGGASFTYSGNIHGPADQRRLRSGYGHEKDRWRTGTEDEWRQIRIEVLAEIYADRDILACQSSLVDDLIKADMEGFTIDDIENLYPNPEDWDAVECIEWLTDHGVAEGDYVICDCKDCAVCKGEKTICEKCHMCTRCHDHLEDCPGCDPTSEDDLRTLIRDNAEAAEVFEWWLVSSWLCDKLRGIGEVVIDNGQGHWWGRCTTGQGYIMDGVLQRIAAQYEDTK